MNAKLNVHYSIIYELKVPPEAGNGSDVQDTVIRNDQPERTNRIFLGNCRVFYNKCMRE